MEISVPLYLNEHRQAGADRITVRALFQPAQNATGTDLERTIHKLSNQLRTHLGTLGRGIDHSELASWHHGETLQHKTLKLDLDLRDSTAKLRVMLVIESLADRKVVFSPDLDQAWFDVYEGENLVERATEFYQAYFRARRKENREFNVNGCSLKGKSWLDWLHLDILLGGKAKPKVDPLVAMLCGEDVSDGAEELRKVGRCVNHVDPLELATPFGVDDALTRLRTLLSVGDRRGVILVGAPGSGKTARIEGVVRDMPTDRSRRLTWHLSPARLISGMSYLGQWQQRVLAILKHAHRRDHILYFDDLLGLFEAGKTRDSSMCVADMLRTQLETHPVRLLAEMTPEAWAIFRRRDPKLAARFVVMPVQPMDRQESTRTMIAAAQQLEARTRCRFDVDTIPEWVSLYDRFEPGSALPGKAIGAMRAVASKMLRRRITRSAVLSDFGNRTGLRPEMIDRQQVISRDELLSQVRGKVVGQDHAVACLVDRVMVTMARMNDRSRPIGTYLLVGPTGVGKTELAKAIASCLFEKGGLIRLDMNELSSPGSASQLVGTFDAPDGLLTSAVRRRPHSVLLLDEIEKAHPAVLDVLLPALGEARLSDARGRTVDLSSLLILMTSNLGTQESLRSTGFVSAGDHDHVRSRHHKAVREFFRPEFFNRIDDVLHFERLSESTIEKIAQLQFRRLLQRDGLQRRNVLIDIAPEAIRLTASRGVDSKMGARSLKRQIERDLIRPASVTLAANPSDTPILLRLSPPTGLKLKSRPNSMTKADAGTLERHRLESYVSIACVPIEYVKRGAPMERSIDQWIEIGQSILERAAEVIDDAPVHYETGCAVDVTTLENLAIRETQAQVETLIDELVDLNHTEVKPPSTPTRPAAGVKMHQTWSDPNPKSRRQDFVAYQEIQDYWTEQLQSVVPGQLNQTIKQLRVEMGRLCAQLAHRGKPTRWRVSFCWFGEKDSQDSQDASLPAAIRDWFAQSESLNVEQIEHPTDVFDATNEIIEVEGALASASIAEMKGSWMMVDARDKTTILEVTAMPADDQTEPAWDHLHPVRRILHARDGNLDLLAGYQLPSGNGDKPFLSFLDQTYYWSLAREHSVDSQARGC